MCLRAHSVPEFRHFRRARRLRRAVPSPTPTRVGRLIECPILATQNSQDVTVKPHSRDESVVAFEYLANLDYPEVQDYLESSLNSENRAIVDEAMTNLILRFDSLKARDKLLKSLNNKDSIISDELKYRLASTFDGNFAVPFRSDNTEFAWKYLVHQRDWSIYNWVHNYTIDYWH